MFIADAIDRLNSFVGKLVSYAIWIGMVVVVYEVVMRYAFNAPTLWAQGYMQRIFAGYFILIGAYTLIERGHVRVDLLLNGRSPRWSAFLDMINYAVLLLWTGALAYEGWFYFNDAWRFGERDDGALGHVLWPVKLALLVGVVLMALQGLAEMMRAAARLWRPEEGRPS
jgi:TRAP-type mannitol/chloroaromatic compound transport system permease small subunit